MRKWPYNDHLNTSIENSNAELHVCC